MRSAQELDAELRRMRRSMRTVIAAVTFAAFVGIALMVGVVGGTLAVVDKNAAQALKGEPRKAEQAPRKTEQAKTEQAKAEQAKAAAAPPPARATESPTQATPAPAPTNGTNTAASTPAPPTAASTPAPAQTNGAASAETKPAPDEATPRMQAEQPKKTDARKRTVRARPETPPDERDIAARDAQGAADAPAARREDARSYRRGYARLRPEDRTRAPEDAADDRVTVITTERPRYARPEVPQRPVYEEREAPRDRGLFGTLFGGRDD